MKTSRDEIIAKYIDAIQSVNKQHGYSFTSEETLQLLLARYNWRFGSARSKIIQKNEFKRRVKEAKRY